MAKAIKQIDDLNEEIRQNNARAEELRAEKEKLLEIINHNTQILEDMRDLAEIEMMLRGYIENPPVERVVLLEKKNILLDKLKKILEI